MNSIGEEFLNTHRVIEISPGRLSVLEEVDEKLVKEYELPLRCEIATIVFCNRGTVDVVINDLSVQLHVDEILFIAPNSIIERFEDKSGDSEISIAIISSAQRFRSMVIDRQLWDLMVYIRKNPVLRFKKDEKEILASFHKLVYQMISLKSKAAYTEQALSSIADAFLYLIFSFQSTRIPSGLRKQDRLHGQRAFLLFIDTLNAGGGMIRSVEEIAGKLCITPKYLARVVKENSGMSPSQWLDEYTMRAIVHQLRHTEKPMKDIAQSMGFPSASSFGTFFRKHAGMSPANYRKKNQ